MASTFQVGGLASGLDTNTIIDKFVELRSVSLTQLQTTQAGAKTQISLLGDLTSKITALDVAARALSTGGVLGAKAVTKNTAFSAVPGSQAVAGEYSVQVLTMAQASKARSQAFADDQLVRGGTLDLTVQGQAYSVTIADGSTLQEVASAIQQSGAGVSATVLDDGTNTYLSLSSTKTGFPIGGSASDALAITETTTGTTGQPLGAALFQTAQNATLTVDGLLFTRQSNQVMDAVPGSTLTLASQGGATETLSLAYDTDATSAKLKTFVDAYNAVIGLVQKQLAVTPETNRSATLAGDLSIRTLQAQLQSLISTTVGGLANVRTLADLGVKTGRDGSLQIDSTTLGAAVARDPSAVNAMFATPGTGLSALTSALTENFTRASDGILTVRSSSLASRVKEMEHQATLLQDRLDAYRAFLVAQFTAMEQLVSGLKNSSTYIANMSSSSSST
jgi:flagellar hook-associated protein 2